ncbi:AAA family ATPase [Modicisalibacter tunisiensis]|uniref:AAA family ATPase n=1 Tax=Modicisalibacter tunisiensis TaxID=390637 RepID=A0ABS7X0M0_9GAMM|nr:AAA family ATPase [Modicisalibacter tunisiensis]MBZ9539056.1 AAA family ATPase [Modicisalibacter tunisiensis]MBZ9567547.1 AAA family ATPase [Modicisalibacter tunisiensis]
MIRPDAAPLAAEPSAPAPLAPRPRDLAEAGLSELYVSDLISKHLFEQGVLDLQELTRCVALAGGLLEPVLAFLRETARVEVRGATLDGLLRFALTERGRLAAQEALARDGYIGPAPVPLAQYAALVERQSMSARSVDRDRVHAAFADIQIRPELLDQLGPALHSGRATFIHGDAGTGKTYIARRLARLLAGEVLIPHAVLVAGKAVRLFDGGVHEPLEAPLEDTASVAESYLNSLHLGQGHDPRYVPCHRPVVVVGGELTMDMLEVQYDTATRIHHAPAQLRANNGMLVIDDLGRQRMPPDELFNRWIVPMEERRDFLSLRSGQHFQVPFDVALVFSSNRHPRDLADPAFLRRIGYKIRFDPLARDEYRTIWQQECHRHGLDADPAMADFVIDALHGRHGVPLLPCHPRDLLGLAMDYLGYRGEAALDEAALRWAWRTYFMEPGAAGEERES